MTKDNTMDEVISSPLTKKEVKASSRKNVIPITSISDLGTVVGEIQSQLSLLIAKLEDDVRPEFKALMDGYINKANESEGLKVNLEDTSLKYEGIKGEIEQLRETNRNIIHELQSAREALKNIESEFNSYQTNARRNEVDYKSKIQELTKQNQEYKEEVKKLEEKIEQVKDNKNSVREEIEEQNFKLRQNEQELIIERNQLAKQLEEYEVLLTEQKEQIEFKTKEAEYKDALLNQLIKKTTTDKMLGLESGFEEDKEKKAKKRLIWFFNK